MLLEIQMLALVDLILLESSEALLVLIVIFLFFCGVHAVKPHIRLLIQLLHLEGGINLLVSAGIHLYGTQRPRAHHRVLVDDVYDI